GDAREVLPTTDRSYDLIMSEPSNPYRAGIGSMFTQEFYQSVDERMADGGIFLQWVQAYEIDARTLRLIYTTLHSVFPHIETWESQLGADLILVATRKPLVHDLTWLQKRVAQEPFKRALRSVWGVRGVYGLFTGFVAGPDFARDLAKESPDEICTDDNSLVEFGFARSVGQNGLLNSQMVRTAAKDRNQHSPALKQAVGLDPVVIREWRQIRFIGEGGRAANLLGVGDKEANQRQRARKAYADDKIQEAFTLWQQQPKAPDNLIDRMILAEGLAMTGNPDVLPLIEAIAAESPVTADGLRTMYTTTIGDLPSAKTFLLRALTNFQSDPWPLRKLISRLITHGERLSSQDTVFAKEFVKVLATPFAVGVEGKQRRMAHARVGLQVDFDNSCVEILSHFEPHPPWSYQVLKARLKCYELNKHPLAEKAREDLEMFVASAAPRLFEVQEGQPAAAPPAAVPATAP
ncbi:MAG: spermidine synthase, partial [Myxococcota bacterium]